MDSLIWNLILNNSAFWIFNLCPVVPKLQLISLLSWLGEGLSWAIFENKTRGLESQTPSWSVKFKLSNKQKISCLKNLLSKKSVVKNSIVKLQVKKPVVKNSFGPWWGPWGHRGSLGVPVDLFWFPWGLRWVPGGFSWVPWALGGPWGPMGVSGCFRKVSGALGGPYGP